MNRRKSELNNRRKTGEGEIKKGRKTCEWTDKWMYEWTERIHECVSISLLILCFCC
jgi:hypothetical protein